MKKAIRGGEFLIKETQAHEIFIRKSGVKNKRWYNKLVTILSNKRFATIRWNRYAKDPTLMPKLMEKQASWVC